MGGCVLVCGGRGGEKVEKNDLSRSMLTLGARVVNLKPVDGDLVACTQEFIIAKSQIQITTHCVLLGFVPILWVVLIVNFKG